MATSTTCMARVADRLPLLLPLATSDNTLCVVVKIRPTLLHFLREKQVWAVIRSKVPITDIADYGKDHSETRYKILVSGVDGNVWVVTMPDRFHPGVITRELLLERSSIGSNDGAVQWFCQQPGVQSVDYTPAGSGLTSLTLMRSVVTPTTLIVSTRGNSESKLQRHQSLELDEIEGEQSTCTLCLSSQVERHSGLLKSLFPDVVNYTRVVAILVGDLDGYVRFSLVQYSSMNGDAATTSVVRNGTLLQLGEPVQIIVPFTCSEPSTPSLEGHEPTLSSAVFDALLVVGTRGRLGVVELKNGILRETLPVPVSKLEIGCAVQSLVYASSLGAFVFCSNGSAFVFKRTDLLAKAHPTDSEAKIPFVNDNSISAEKLPLQPGILRVATQGDASGISILFASGQITTVNEASLRAMVVSVLPLSEQQNRICGGASYTGEPASECRVRNLLHGIAQVSSESSTLREKSKHMDHRLKTLHSALEILRVVETAGVESVVKCELRASMVTTGSFSDRQTVKLVCSLRFVNPEAIVSFDDWWLCLNVRIRHRVLTTYSFPMKAMAIRREQSIVLDPDMLAQQDQGSLGVSCSMVFYPSGSVCTESKQSDADHTKSKTLRQDSPLSFGIPLLQDRRFLFAQLCQPVEGETPVSQVALHSAFRQNHEPFMPIDTMNKESKATSSALWSGVQWWAALADHAQKNPSFTTLWSKITPPDSVSLALSPPSRFVISIPSFFTSEDDDEDDDDVDEDFEKIRVERMVSFIRQLLEIPIDEVPQLRRSCRTQHGKLWTVLRTFTGSLILLRFIPSEDRQRSVDLIIQCSDVADLSAIRALVLDVINNWSNRGSRVINEDCYDELKLDMNEMLEPIAALEKLVEGLTLKTSKSLEVLHSTSCTDEVLHTLSQLAQLETQTLTLYWKTRIHLNRTIM